MGGGHVPGHFPGKIVARVGGFVVIEAAAEDVSYLTVGETYDFDVTPAGGHSDGGDSPETVPGT